MTVMCFGHRQEDHPPVSLCGKKNWLNQSLTSCFLSSWNNLFLICFMFLFSGCCRKTQQDVLTELPATYFLFPLNPTEENLSRPSAHWVLHPGPAASDQLSRGPPQCFTGTIWGPWCLSMSVFVFCNLTCYVASEITASSSLLRKTHIILSDDQ